MGKLIIRVGVRAGPPPVDVWFEDEPCGSWWACDIPTRQSDPKRAESGRDREPGEVRLVWCYGSHKPASSHAERASIDAKWSHSFSTVGFHQLLAIHAVAGDCSVKGGADRFISSMRSFLLHQSQQESSKKGIHHGQELQAPVKTDPSNRLFGHRGRWRQRQSGETPEVEYSFSRANHGIVARFSIGRFTKPLTVWEIGAPCAPDGMTWIIWINHRVASYWYGKEKREWKNNERAGQVGITSVGHVWGDRLAGVQAMRG
ncbi:hypothetical protein JCGZ_05396 [Jatropha curcas]|uniref:Uncharacterized protein n=1 Tax=Jatropha curcas TaxID=180498 RepID=A0A067LI71_JATCU|nr:hypothetical protein JCGZ_05396 [Jatropha curcas]